MSRLLRLLLLCLLLCATQGRAEVLKAWGYIGWWLPQGWRTAPLGEFERLLFFGLPIEADGAVRERHGWPEQWEALRQAAALTETPIDLTLTLLDAKTFRNVFGSDAAIQRLLDDATTLAQQEQVNGLHLDVETYDEISPALLAAFRKFVQTLTLRLQALPRSKALSVFIPMGGKTPLYDAASLIGLDRVVLQGYDAHWAESKFAGPVAPLDGPSALTWKKVVVASQGLGVPKNKLMLSFPLYGYEWIVKSPKLYGQTLGKGVSTTFARLSGDLELGFPVHVEERVLAHGATYDAFTGSSHYQFKNIKGQHVEGWFDDWWTMSRKSDYLEEQGFGGIAFFLLGYDAGRLVNHFVMRRSLKQSTTTPDVVVPSKS